jgi:hypothetical protein
MIHRFCGCNSRVFFCFQNISQMTELIILNETYILYYSDAPVSELSLELLLLQVVLPALLEQGHTRMWLKGLVRGWTLCVAWMLNLRSYLVGDVQLDDHVSYCKIIIIGRELIIMFFVDRPIHKFKIQLNFISSAVRLYCIISFTFYLLGEKTNLRTHKILCPQN